MKYLWRYRCQWQKGFFIMSPKFNNFSWIKLLSPTSQEIFLSSFQNLTGCYSLVSTFNTHFSSNNSNLLMRKQLQWVHNDHGIVFFLCKCRIQSLSIRLYTTVHSQNNSKACYNNRIVTILTWKAAFQWFIWSLILKS